MAVWECSLSGTTPAALELLAVFPCVLLCLSSKLPPCVSVTVSVSATFGPVSLSPVSAHLSQQYGGHDNHLLPAHYKSAIVTLCGLCHIRLDGRSSNLGHCASPIKTRCSTGEASTCPATRPPDTFISSGSIPQANPHTKTGTWDEMGWDVMGRDGASYVTDSIIWGRAVTVCLARSVHCVTRGIPARETPLSTGLNYCTIPVSSKGPRHCNVRQRSSAGSYGLNGLLHRSTDQHCRTAQRWGEWQASSRETGRGR